MNKYTYNDFKTLYFRKSKLTSALQKLIDLVSGSSVLIKPYMEDENGCYNEGKTLSFIDDLMCALKTYLNFARATQIADYGEDDSDYDFYAVSQEEEMCYKGFIYCALRVIYSNYLELCNQTFSSLVIMLDHTQIYRSYTELIKNLYMNWHNPEEHHGWGNNAYDTFAYTNNIITKSYSQSNEPSFQDYYLVTDEEMQEMLRSLTMDEKKQLKEWDETEKKIKAFEKELYKEEDITQEMIDDVYFYEEEQKEEMKYIDEYIMSFVNPQNFRENLSAFFHYQHKLGTIEKFKDVITGMIDFFMLAKGKSSIANADKFYFTLARLQKVIGQTSAMLNRSEG